MRGMDIDTLKRAFMAEAYEVCPGFTIEPSMKELMNDIFRWCIMDDTGRYNPDKGLWLYGDIGTGKTTMLEIVKRFCRYYRPWQDSDGSGRYFVPYSFRISNAVKVCDDFSRHGYAGIDTYIDSTRQAFDELGSESVAVGHFGTVQNVFQYILQRRYEMRHTGFTHATTNMELSEISQRYGARIWDRCKEMFNFVEFSGASWRKRN